MLHTALLLILAVLAPVVEGPRFHFETPAGETFDGDWLGIQADGLRLGTSTGRVVSPVVVVEARPDTAVPGEASPDLLVFRARRPGARGDRLAGHLVGGDDVGLRWLAAGGEVLEVPFEVVDRVLPGVDRPLDRLLELAPAGFDDRLWRRRDDGTLDDVAGVLASVDAEGLLMETALGDLRFTWAEVLAVALSGTEHPGGALAGHQARVALHDGSVFEAGLADVSQGRLVLDTSFRRDWHVPLSAVASVLLSDRRDEAPLLLADQQPEQVREWPSLGGDALTLFPWRSGLAVAGGPLRTGGLMRASGWGVHAHSELTVSVPEGAHWLRVTVGLTDDVLELPARGSLDVTLLLDGVPVAPTRRLVEGQAPAVLRVDGLEPGQQLLLRVGDGGDHDAGDRAAWVDGLFGRDSAL